MPILPHIITLKLNDNSQPTQFPLCHLKFTIAFSCYFLSYLLFTMPFLSLFCNPWFCHKLMSVFSFLCVLWEISPSRRTLGGYAKGRSSYVRSHVPKKRQSFTCLEVPVLKGSSEVQEHSGAHAVRWPSLASTHLYRNLFYDIITSGVGILFCEMPCVGWDHTVRNCVSSFPAIRAGGLTVQKGGPLCSCTAAKASTTHTNLKRFSCWIL